MANNKELKEAHQKINGVATDLLMHIDDLIEDEAGKTYWSQYLAKKCNITVEKALQLINDNLS